MLDGLVPVKRALISVSDKKGLVKFVKQLVGMGIEIISTGGTAKELRQEGILLSEVSELTDFPEIMDGRVKTLHPRIHGGLLAVREDSSHVSSMKDLNILEIDLLVVNLYPFDETVSRGASLSESIENIDVGGPAMIRAAAKNYRYVSVISDRADYAGLIEELEKYDCSTRIEFRQNLSQIAFSVTASYDALIASWMANNLNIKHPRNFIVSGKLRQNLRYGENSHQTAAYYSTALKHEINSFELLQGKELSYNNINDLNAACNLLEEFSNSPLSTAVIIKHANPCGVAQSDNIFGAYIKAFDCDRVSAFGGIVALNRALDSDTAEVILDTFFEVIIAPSFSANAQNLLSQKKNLRVIKSNGLSGKIPNSQLIKNVSDGFLVQDQNTALLLDSGLKSVTERKPTEQELADLIFSWSVGKHVKSNAIIFSKNCATIGIGAGQMSRVDSTKIARQKALEMAKLISLSQSPSVGAVAASDAFFPFPDGIQEIYEAGVTAIIQPGGSIRDSEVIELANKLGIAMVFTGIRHFLH